MSFEGCFFDTTDYETTNKILGEGAFGKVYIVENVNDNKLYAAKIINTRGIFSSHDQTMLLRESLNLYKLNHPAIVKFLGINFHSFDDPSKLEPTILTEYLPNGSLKEILDKEKKSISDSNWSPTKKYIALLGISDAMRYLHKVGIIHRDLKPQNILMDSNYYPHVCDFGLSRCFEDSLSNSMMLSMTGKVGTPLYMAPELLMEDEHYGAAVDVYAFAILAYEIVTGKEPFSDKGKAATLKTLLSKISRGGRPEFTEGVQDNMKELLSQCWSQNANDRPSFETIFQKLSSEFTYLDESVDEDEINEYLMNLEESRMQSVKEDLNDPSKKKDAYIKKIEDENKEIQTELIKLKDENKKLKDQLSKNGDIQKELDKLKKENEDFKKKISQHTEDRRQLQAELDKLKEENQLLKKASQKDKPNDTKPETKQETKHNDTKSETKSETKKDVIKVAINGFGRIGRNVFRAVRQLYPRKIQIVAIHDNCDMKTNIHLLKYDTATRTFTEPITVLDQDRFEIGSGESKWIVHNINGRMYPQELPWKKLDVDIVLESSGQFRRSSQKDKNTYGSYDGHLLAGAKRVVLTTTPLDEADCSIVIGVNDKDIVPKTKVVYNPSSTVNCMAPIMKLLNEKYGVISGFVTSVHAMTNEQKALDVFSRDLRLARCAAGNIIPTKLSDIKYLSKVVHGLTKDIDGVSIRVPVSNGSLVDLSINVREKYVGKHQVNDVLRKACESPALKGVMRFTNEPIVSSDVRGDPHSSIVDGLSTMVLNDTNGSFVKVTSLYDNEWMYSCRCADIFYKLSSYL